MRSRLASKSGSLESFQVLVRWEVAPRRASRVRRASGVSPQVFADVGGELLAEASCRDAR
ncbi:hypothetical protein ADK60_12965 [Streptomyces sp. XY431]|nr:hypothetical protein ADK60_12965 [Streptomyces sp. XY431]